jgi:hypothetical protein
MDVKLVEKTLGESGTHHIYLGFFSSSGRKESVHFSHHGG